MWEPFKLTPNNLKRAVKYDNIVFGCKAQILIFPLGTKSRKMSFTSSPAMLMKSGVNTFSKTGVTEGEKGKCLLLYDSAFRKIKH